MHKLDCLFVLICFFTVSLPAQSYSDQSKMSLLTSSQGDELYTTFGHSAIRIQDPVNGKDMVYNYGIFNFRTPNFYTKFVRGKLLYRLGLQRMSSFQDVYIRENRRVIEQELNLTVDQKRKVMAFLETNYLPENREYKYDFFYDNCATRIRDLMETELAPLFAYENIPSRKVTFRQLLDEYLTRMPWADFGIDLILGLPADDIADHRNQMFLPDYLAWNLGLAQVNNPGNKTPLLSAPVEIVPFQFERKPVKQIFNPLVVTSLLGLLIFLLTWGIRNRHLQNIIDYLLFFTLGIMGLVFLFMWLGTDHQSCHKNLNMLWANPLYLLLIPFAIVKDWSWFWMLLGIISILLIVLFPIFPQQYHIAFIPLFLIILIRAAYRYTRKKAA